MDNPIIQTILDETTALRADLESRRERYFRLYIMGVPMAFAATCAIAAMHTDEGTFPWAIVGMITFAITFIGFHIANGLYRHSTKRIFLERIASALGLEYRKKGSFTVPDIEHHKIIPPHDTAYTEDGFSGRINNVSVAFQEIRLTDSVPERQSDGRYEDREQDVFWGLVIRIGIAKKLEAHTVVLPRNGAMTFLRTAFSAFERVKLASPKFEKMFDVMSTSQLESRYILDPAFMERFMDAGTLLGAKWMEASFKGSEIAFAVQRNKPMFEIGWFFKPLTEKMLVDVTNEIRTVIDLVSVLKLNPYTGLGAALPSRDDDDA